MRAGSFNEAVLVVTFILLEAPVPKLEIYPGSFSVFNNLVARRCLQGILSKEKVGLSQSQLWVPSVKAALLSLGPTFGSQLPETVHREVLPNCTTNPAFTDKASTLISDAIVLYSSPPAIVEIFAGEARSEKLQDGGSEFWLFVLACSSGNTQLVQEKFDALHEDQRLLLPHLFLRSIVNNWMAAVKFLLDEGHVSVNGKDRLINGSQWPASNFQCPLIVAAFWGRIELVQLFLKPEYGLRRTGKEYDRALHWAGPRTNVPMRKRIVDLLLLHGYDLRATYHRFGSMPSLREEGLLDGTRYS